MGLIKQTNAQYYSGQVPITLVSGVNQDVFTFDLKGETITSAYDSNYNQVASESNFNLFHIPNINSSPILIPENEIYLLNNKASIKTLNTYSGGVMVLQFKQSKIDKNYGSYEYTSMSDVVNNFMIAYVGPDKLITKVKRSDVVFHFKRGLSEFSYDTLRSINSQELTVPPSLSIPLPQDYVNYVNISWVDKSGVKRTIYPTTLTSDPTQLLIQDADGIPTQNEFSENNLAQESQTEELWKSKKFDDISAWENYAWGDYWGYYPTLNWYGRMYGMQPETGQVNGWFTINKRTGSISFSSDLNGLLIIFEYISDGLAFDNEMKIPKLAEQAMYLHLVYSILSTRRNIPENIVLRYKKEKSAALRNAKIRLSNLKLNEFVQVMRGKSKWIKH